MIENLHAHTSISDGSQDYIEILKTSSRIGISITAFTDHDSLPGKEDIKRLLEIKNYQARWILGIELSSNLPPELDNRYHSKFHILGLFVDPFNKELNEHCLKSTELKIDRVKIIIDNLIKFGFNIDIKDCYKKKSCKALGMPHVVELLELDNNNLQIVKEIRQKMEKDAQFDLKIKAKYDAMMALGEKQYWYTLFLSDDAYINGIYPKKQSQIDFDKAVVLIRNAGGVSFLAHYYTVFDVFNKELLEKIIKEKRIDGLETVFGLSTNKSGTIENIGSTMEIVKDLVLRNNILSSGGADSHNEEDLIKFAKNKDYSLLTDGLTKEMISQKKIDISWSSL